MPFPCPLKGTEAWRSALLGDPPLEVEWKPPTETRQLSVLLLFALNLNANITHTDRYSAKKQQ